MKTSVAQLAVPPDVALATLRGSGAHIAGGWMDSFVPLASPIRGSNEQPLRSLAGTHYMFA